MEKFFGGNRVNTIASFGQQFVNFSESAYSYSFYSKDVSEVFKTSLNSYCLYLLSGALQLADKEIINPGQSVQVENESVEFKIVKSSQFLVVGTSKSFKAEASINVFQSSQLKRIEKPWGFEVWITGEHPQYCLKNIFIKKGTRTSLQYHRQKTETNVLFEGSARLHYRQNENVSLDEVTPEDLAFYDLTPTSTIDIQPFTLHRLEALTDILLYEASTAHLDDVVRVSDDTNRANGRIKSEHGN